MQSIEYGNTVAPLVMSKNRSPRLRVVQYSYRYLRWLVMVCAVARSRVFSPGSCEAYCRYEYEPTSATSTSNRNCICESVQLLRVVAIVTFQGRKQVESRRKRTYKLIKCELDSLHASEAWDEGLEWESYQFGRTVFSTSAGIEHELE